MPGINEKVIHILFFYLFTLFKVGTILVITNKNSHLDKPEQALKV